LIWKKVSNEDETIYEAFDGAGGRISLKDREIYPPSVPKGGPSVGSRQLSRIERQLSITRHREEKER
jgi:hypothetical protein